MNFFKLILVALLLMLASKVSMADSHDAEQNIIDKAKEINQKIKKKQSNTQANISSEIGNNEEPLPLNDPFVGDSSLTGAYRSRAFVGLSLISFMVMPVAAVRYLAPTR